MKTISIRVIVGCISLVSFSMSSFGQAPMMTTKEGGKMPVKLEKSIIPTIVTETYIKEYPMTMDDGWYGYPAFTNQADWYEYNPYLYSNENPEYYVVEFTKDDTPNKVIYSKAGKKIATHKKLRAAVPKEILTAIGKGKYKGWKLTDEKEEIFKDKDSDKMKVYKVEVEKGKEKHDLFYSGTGKLLKDEKMKF